ncbi:hypothetical protein C8J57DRAFT_1504728 [Mycena rebaudengoi]|nr:hypothetical protein C8J57DRAFT_1504728 [Mycena rebaudengoi]
MDGSRALWAILISIAAALKRQQFQGDVNTKHSPPFTVASSLPPSFRPLPSFFRNGPSSRPRQRRTTTRLYPSRIDGGILVGGARLSSAARLFGMNVAILVAWDDGILATCAPAALARFFIVSYGTAASSPCVARAFADRVTTAFYFYSPRLRWRASRVLLLPAGAGGACGYTPSSLRSVSAVCVRALSMSHVRAYGERLGYTPSLARVPNDPYARSPAWARRYVERVFISQLAGLAGAGMPIRTRGRQRGRWLIAVPGFWTCVRARMRAAGGALGALAFGGARVLLVLRGGIAGAGLTIHTCGALGWRAVAPPGDVPVRALGVRLLEGAASGVRPEARAQALLGAELLEWGVVRDVTAEILILRAVSLGAYARCPRRRACIRRMCDIAGMGRKKWSARGPLPPPACMRDLYGWDDAGA